MASIAWNLIKEVLLAIAGRIAFKAILERFVTRVIIQGLRWLSKLSSNDVVDQTVQDIISQLRGKRLTEADRQ